MMSIKFAMEEMRNKTSNFHTERKWMSENINVLNVDFISYGGYSNFSSGEYFNVLNFNSSNRNKRFYIF